MAYRKHNICVQLVVCWTPIFFNVVALRHQSRLHRTGKNIGSIYDSFKHNNTPNFSYNAVGCHLSMALILCIDKCQCVMLYTIENGFSGFRCQILEQSSTTHDL